MVIEGQFVEARYDTRLRSQTEVTLKLILDDAELEKLQNGLMNRRMDVIQMVINSSTYSVADPNDTPKTTTESW